MGLFSNFRSNAQPTLIPTRGPPESSGSLLVSPPPPQRNTKRKKQKNILCLLLQEEEPAVLHVPWQWKEGRDPASIVFTIHEEEKHSNRRKKLKNILIKSNQSSSLKLCFEKKQQQQQQEEEESGMPSIPKLRKFQAKRSFRFNPISVSLVNAAEAQGYVYSCLERKKDSRSRQLYNVL